MSEAHVDGGELVDEAMISRVMAKAAEGRKRDAEHAADMLPFGRAAFYYARLIRSAMVDEYALQHKIHTTGRFRRSFLTRKKQNGVEFGVLTEDESVLATLQTPLARLSVSEGEAPRLFAVQLRADSDTTQSFTRERDMDFPWFDFSRSNVFVIDRTPDDVGKIGANTDTYEISPERSNIADTTKVDVGPDLDLWPCDESSRRLVAILRRVEDLFYIKQ